MFTGLSAFPLTPLRDDELDISAFTHLVQRLAQARVDSITALGSTGAYAYLTIPERALVCQLAVEHADETPVFVGIGSLRTSHILKNANNAENAGASGLLLAPMSYQPLTDNDVFELFKMVTEESSLPVIVYDNPSTTRFRFSLDLYGRIAQLPNIASIKIPGVPSNSHQAQSLINDIRKVVPEHVTIGVSGDATAVMGLTTGCDAWYSVIGGTLPDLALRITAAARAGREAEAFYESERLTPLWQLFAEAGGSFRIIASVAQQLGLVSESCLPLPIQRLTDEQQARVAFVIGELGLRV